VRGSGRGAGQAGVQGGRGGARGRQAWGGVHDSTGSRTWLRVLRSRLGGGGRIRDKGLGALYTPLPCPALPCPALSWPRRQALDRGRPAAGGDMELRICSVEPTLGQDRFPVGAVCRQQHHRERAGGVWSNGVLTCVSSGLCRVEMFVTLWMWREEYQHHEQLPLAFNGTWPSWNSDLDNRPW